MDYLQLAKNIEKIAREAGLFIKNAHISQVSEKDGAANIVTNIDVASQQLIVSQCQKLLPESKFIAEEDEVRILGEDYTWVIDPIDGTTNYAYGYQHSAISIALLHEKKGIIGVVYNPFLDEMFTGINGIGSFLNDQPIHVSSNKMDHALVIVGTAPYHKEFADQTFERMKRLYLAGRDVRRSGSACLDLCYLAAGRCDAFFEMSLSPWDYGAAEVILRNAGGKYEAIAPDVFGYEKAIGLIAANPICFDDFKVVALGDSNE